MPRKRTTVDPDAVLTCVESYSAGPGLFYAEGERLRRGSIAAYSEPYWIADGSTTEDVHKAREVLRGDWRPPADREAPTPVPKVRAIRAFTAAEHLVGMDGGPRSGIIIVNEGDVFPEGHPLARKYKANFAPAGDVT